MKINVKILQGAECNVDVELGDSIERLKELVQSHLNISPANQRLLHRGKTLQDGTQIKVGPIIYKLNTFIKSFIHDFRTTVSKTATSSILLLKRTPLPQQACQPLLPL